MKSPMEMVPIYPSKIIRGMTFCIMARKGRMMIDRLPHSSRYNTSIRDSSTSRWNANMSVERISHGGYRKTLSSSPSRKKEISREVFSASFSVGQRTIKVLFTCLKRIEMKSDLAEPCRPLRCVSFSLRPIRSDKISNADSFNSLPIILI